MYLAPCGRGLTKVNPTRWTLKSLNLETTAPEVSESLEFGEKKNPRTRQTSKPCKFTQHPNFGILPAQAPDKESPLECHQRHRSAWHTGCQQSRNIRVSTTITSHACYGLWLNLHFEVVDPYQGALLAIKRCAAKGFITGLGGHTWNGIGLSRV